MFTLVGLAVAFVGGGILTLVGQKYINYTNVKKEISAVETNLKAHISTELAYVKQHVSAEVSKLVVTPKP